MERLLCRLDDVVIGGSDYTARLYRGLGLPAGRVTAIPYGVNTERFAPPSVAYRAASREAMCVEDDTFVVCMVAYVYGPKRMVHRGRGIKGHDVLLAAWREFQHDRPDARLVMLGGGFGEAGVAHKRELLARFDVARDDTIDWHESVVDVRDCYAAADCSVSPSLSDNHGAAVEASAMGVPSIVTDAGALPETIGPDSGWLVPKDNVQALTGALREAYAAFHDGSLARRGALARARTMRTFAEGSTAAAVADVLERVAMAGDRRVHQR